MSDVTRMEDWQVREVSHAPTSGLEGVLCQAIIRAHRERQARQEQMRARFGCQPPPWASEYIRTGRFR